MLEVRNLAASYGPAQVLFDIGFSVNAGEVVTRLGRNGMGKSTTINTIMGWVPPRSGTVHFAGQDITGRAPYQVAKAGIGLVPEGRRVFPSLSVEENLLATARGATPGNSASWHLGRVYELFPRLQERRQQSARTLSGGEQQMLAVGRALLTNPRLLILDEATEGLAPLIRQEIWHCLRRLKEDGQTILVIDKNLKEMATLVDRHHVLEKGRVVWEGTPREFGQNPELANRYLGV